VTATGEETALAHVIAAVQRAQSSRAEIQRLGDRVSNVFVPAVVAIALAAGIFWGIHSGAEKAFVIAAGILIIACPCAMGLATPAAIMAAANSASRRGILIRDGVALEKAGKISAIVFDKTGTLTMGKPEVAAVQNSEVQSLAAALARNSTHPISQAIAKLSAEEIQILDWKEIRGSGIEAKSDSKIMRLGSLRWLREIGVDLAAGEKFVSEWSNQGATIVGLAEERKLIGLFAVRDAVKSNAASVVGQLRRQGLKAFLVTGDNFQTATAIAKQVGIAAENIFAEVRPEQKAEFVKKLQAAGERVAFVGDGINDAPALMQADLGIAVSRASDIAREAADIILLKSEIEAVPEALGLARATLRTIKQNLFWAFFYNALGVPLAAMGFINPIFCAAAMGVSDLVVIGNALRLLRWKTPDHPNAQERRKTN
jgi:Cu+-exporting ATPase